MGSEASPSLADVLSGVLLEAACLLEPGGNCCVWCSHGLPTEATPIAPLKKSPAPAIYAQYKDVCNFIKYITFLCHGRDGAVRERGWAGWRCGFFHKFIILQERWCNPGGRLGGSVWWFPPCCVILAEGHGWVMGFPGLFSTPWVPQRLQRWSCILEEGHGSFLPIHLQLPQYLSMSLVTGLVRGYLIDDYTICFLISCCFPVLASITSGRFCTSWWSAGHLHSMAICVLEHTKTILPQGWSPGWERPQALLHLNTSVLTSNLFTYVQVFLSLSSVFFHICSSPVQFDISLLLSLDLHLNIP